MGSCFTGGDYRKKEETLFKRIKELQTSIDNMSSKYVATEYALKNAKAEWIVKENDYLKQLNDLHSRVHQQDVICKQYQIYEENLESERQTIIELQSEIEQLKKKNSSCEKALPPPTTHNDESATCEGETQ